MNLGAILRTAEAAGVTGVFTTAGTTDPFSPKSLRGAMGAAFRLPIWIGIDYDGAVAMVSQTFNPGTLCADAKATQNYTEVDWRRPTALIVGSESAEAIGRRNCSRERGDKHSYERLD